MTRRFGLGDSVVLKATKEVMVVVGVNTGGFRTGYESWDYIVKSQTTHWKKVKTNEIREIPNDRRRQDHDGVLPDSTLYGGPAQQSKE